MAGMNYYNGYMGGGSPYGSMYPGSQYPTFQQQPQQMMYQQPPQQQPNAVLNGKIVDSEDIVKATEVPIGGYGIFPKGDLSEIYVKSWNNNGTTNIITFKPVLENAQVNGNQQSMNDVLLQKIENLENKIDKVLNQSNALPTLENMDKKMEGQIINGL